MKQKKKTLKQLERVLKREKKKAQLEDSISETKRKTFNLKHRKAISISKKIATTTGKLTKGLGKQLKKIKLKPNANGDKWWSTKPSKLTSSLYKQEKGGKKKMETAQEIIDKEESDKEEAKEKESEKEEKEEKEDLLAPSKEGAEMLAPSGKEF